MKPDFSKMKWRATGLWLLLLCFAALSFGLIASGLCLYVACMAMVLAMMRFDWECDFKADDRVIGRNRPWSELEAEGFRKPEPPPAPPKPFFQ